jgi:hypothetical protein
MASDSPRRKPGHPALRAAIPLSATMTSDCAGRAALRSRQPWPGEVSQQVMGGRFPRCGTAIRVHPRRHWQSNLRQERRGCYGRIAPNHYRPHRCRQSPDATVQSAPVRGAGRCKDRDGGAGQRGVGSPEGGMIPIRRHSFRSGCPLSGPFPQPEWQHVDLGAEEVCAPTDRAGGTRHGREPDPGQALGDGMGRRESPSVDVSETRRPARTRKAPRDQPGACGSTQPWNLETRLP